MHRVLTGAVLWLPGLTTRQPFFAVASSREYQNVTQLGGSVKLLQPSWCGITLAPTRAALVMMRLCVTRGSRKPNERAICWSPARNKAARKGART